MFFRQSGGDSVCFYSVLVNRSLGDSFDHSLLSKESSKFIDRKILLQPEAIMEN